MTPVDLIIKTRQNLKIKLKKSKDIWIQKIE